MCSGALLSQAVALRNHKPPQTLSFCFFERGRGREERRREDEREVRTFQFSSVTCERIPTETPAGDGANVRERLKDKMNDPSSEAGALEEEPKQGGQVAQEERERGAEGRVRGV